MSGLVAVVTGPLGKLGPLWVRTLREHGADVVGIDVGSEGAEELAAPPGGGSYTHEIADVTDRAALDRIRDRVLSEGGAPQVLVSSAGVDSPPSAGGQGRLVDEVSSEEFRGVVDVNLTGTFHTIQSFGSAMAAAGAGSIVTIGSLYAGMAPDPKLYDHIELDPPFLKPPAYGASKAGVLNLSRYFARLWGPRGVRVNMLSPGGVLGGQDTTFVQKFSDRTALGRMAELDDLAGPLLFLASDASRYVTGQELRVDGGFFL